MIRKLRKATASQTPIAATVCRPLCRPSERALIISHKFLNALGREFVCKVKAISRKVLDLSATYQLGRLPYHQNRFGGHGYLLNGVW
jgi:hypothetical protein